MASCEKNANDSRAEHGRGGEQKLSEVYESAQSTKEGRRIVVTLKYAARTIHTEICPSSFGLPSFLPSFLPLDSVPLFFFVHYPIFKKNSFFWIQLHHKSFSSQLCEVKMEVERSSSIRRFSHIWLQVPEIEDHPQEDLATFGYGSQRSKIIHKKI